MTPDYVITAFTWKPYSNVTQYLWYWFGCMCVSAFIVL